MRPVTSDEAFARGRSDCKRHKSAHAVPYKARDAAIHWEKGWWFEKDLIQREKNVRQECPLKFDSVPGKDD